MPGVYLLRADDGASGSRASGTGASLLDRGTLSGRKRKTLTGERVLCVTNFAEVGVIEYGWSKGGNGGKHGTKGKSQNKEENRLRALRRARRSVRQACLHVKACFILTLTYHENMQNRRLAILHRQEFDRRMRRHYADWRYVGVLETQKRGALHWHMAMPFKVDQAVALKEWRMVTGDPTITQVHVGFKPNGKGNAFSKCASYTAKYIGKDMNQRAEEEHHYHIARGMKPPVERLVIPDDAESITEIRMIFESAWHLMGKDIEMWTAPFPPGATYGYMRAERRMIQPKGGEG